MGVQALNDTLNVSSGATTGDARRIILLYSGESIQTVSQASACRMPPQKSGLDMRERSSDLDE